MPPVDNDHARWLAAAARLAARGRPASAPNPAVGAIVVKDGRVIARGWTRAGGRPHAEAVALEAAGRAARGATLYVTLEPCAHESARGLACADLIAQSGLARVVAGIADPDPRTCGKGAGRIREAGIQAEVLEDANARASLAGYLLRARENRPFVTLKLAMSLDGAIATGEGESRWITGPEARAHVHAVRARQDAIIVGGATLRADEPRLDVRLPGYGGPHPMRFALSRSPVPGGWTQLPAADDLSALAPAQYAYVEGGAGAAAAFLAADKVDALHLYRAPILVGGGRPALSDIGLPSLAEAHGHWRMTDSRRLGSDRFEAYERVRDQQDQREI